MWIWPYPTQESPWWRVDLLSTLWWMGSKALQHLHTNSSPGPLPPSPCVTTSLPMSTSKSWGKLTRTMIPWRQGFRHPTRNKCMGWFPKSLPSIQSSHLCWARWSYYGPLFLYTFFKWKFSLSRLLKSAWKCFRILTEDLQFTPLIQNIANDSCFWHTCVFKGVYYHNF